MGENTSYGSFPEERSSARSGRERAVPRDSGFRIVRVRRFSFSRSRRAPVAFEIDASSPESRTATGRCIAVKFHGSTRSNCYDTPIIRLAALQHRSRWLLLLSKHTRFDKPRCFIAVSAFLRARRLAAARRPIRIRHPFDRGEIRLSIAAADPWKRCAVANAPVIRSDRASP